MEGLRPSNKQTTMEDGLLAPTMMPRGSMGIYLLNYFPEMEETPPVEMSDRTCWAQRAEKQTEHAPVEGKGSIVYLLVELVFESPVHATRKKPKLNQTEPRSGSFAVAVALVFV
jgi:hypothetical protein